MKKLLLSLAMVGLFAGCDRQDEEGTGPGYSSPSPATSRPETNTPPAPSTPTAPGTTTPTTPGETPK